MFTNDLKKGDRIQLRNGWYGTLMDNARGNTRMCEVEGLYLEVGSVYAHDIVKHIPRDGQPVLVEHTKNQEKLRERVNLLGF